MILLEERLVRILLGVVRVVTLQFHAEGLLVGLFIGLVDGALGFPRRCHIEKRVLLRRRDAVDNVGKEAI